MAMPVLMLQLINVAISWLELEFCEVTLIFIIDIISLTKLSKRDKSWKSNFCW